MKLWTSAHASMILCPVAKSARVTNTKTLDILLLNVLNDLEIGELDILM